jgi:hypothetical protein
MKGAGPRRPGLPQRTGLRQHLRFHEFIDGEYPIAGCGEEAMQEKIVNAQSES